MNEDTSMSKDLAERIAKFLANGSMLVGYTGKDGHRMWWSGGAWLHPGDAIWETTQADLDALRNAAPELIAAAKREARLEALLRRVKDRDRYGYAIPDDLRAAIAKELDHD